MAHRSYSTALGHIVDPTAGQGDFTTIATALTAASSGQTIFLRPGTYTENISLKAGVNITAYSCDGLTPNVTIAGKCSFSGAGTVTLSGIRLQTNSDYCLEVTGSSASFVNLDSCYINCTNNTGLNYTCSSGSSVINFFNCQGNLATTGISYATVTGGANIRFVNCFLTNTGNSLTATSVSSGTILFQTTLMNGCLSTSSTGAIIIENSVIDTSAINTASLTHNGTGTGSQVFNSILNAGSASAVSSGAGATVNLFNNCIGSSNTNAVTGSGTVLYNSNEYTSSSSVINTTTQTAAVTRTAVTRSTLQPCVIAYKSADDTNATGDGTAFTVIFDTEVKDQSNSYNNSTGTFTAPYTGSYLFTGSVGLTALGSTTTSKVAVTATSRTLQGNSWNGGAIKSAGNQADHCFTCIIDMTAGDTCTIVVTASGTTKTVTVQGNTVTTTYLGVYLLC